MRYWYRFLRFLGYTRFVDAADFTWSPVTGNHFDHIHFYDRNLNEFIYGPIDWTSDTIKVRLVNSIYPYQPELWCDWRWVD